jgi:hypothetical protein
MRHAFMSVQNAPVIQVKDMTLVDLIDPGKSRLR